MTSGPRPVCTDCRHFKPSDDGLVCDAFPRGIPDVVILGGNPHTEPLPGDHGIRFEPKPDGLLRTALRVLGR